MSGCLYILSGASGCGKTTLLNSLCTSETAKELSIVKAPKFSERERRPNDPDDDIIHVKSIHLGEFDIAYVINNTVYGIKLYEINRLLEEGGNCFIIISDLRVVRRLKGIFGQRARSVYVASAIDPDRLHRIQQERLGFRPDAIQKSILSRHFERVNAAARLGWWDRVSGCVQELYTDWRAYATDSQSTEIRAQRIRAFYIRYIEYIQLFDHVILNYTEDRPEEMAKQMINLVKAGKRIDELRNNRKYPPLFILAAASSSGKGTLMEMLNLIGSDRISIVSKMAKRKPKENDKRDGMIAIGPDGEFPPTYDFRWIFHKKEELGVKGVEYAVSTGEIERNIEAKRAQIVVSNFEQFPIFRQRWPEHAIFLYLYRLSSSEDIRAHHYGIYEPTEAEARIAEIGEVHSNFIHHIPEIDHILLNTSFREDLYDQMFQLISHYENINLETEFNLWRLAIQSTAPAANG